MPILQWMCYRKLRSACMRLTIRSPFRAVLQYVSSQFLSRTRVNIGCVSAKPNLKTPFSFASALDFHYICKCNQLLLNVCNAGKI